jgi:hypothetical protein
LMLAIKWLTWRFTAYSGQVMQGSETSRSLTCRSGSVREKIDPQSILTMPESEIKGIGGGGND